MQTKKLGPVVKMQPFFMSFSSFPYRYATQKIRTGSENAPYISYKEDITIDTNDILSNAKIELHTTSQPSQIIFS